jgi:methylated-DNA-protein-cysteine methyltransferase-like protein
MVADRSFNEQVYELVKQVPSGLVTTYGAVARELGLPRAARQVGWAMAALRPGHDVPAHRVVNAEGALSGGWAFGAPEVQRALLEEEGIRFDDRGRVKLADHLWPGGKLSGGR